MIIISNPNKYKNIKMESKTNDYQLKQGNMIYILSTSIVDNAIRLSCKNQTGKKYSRDFTIYDLGSIDQIFNQIKSEQEAIQYLDKALKIYKVGVSEENGIIKIIFYITAKGGVMKAVEISLGEEGTSFLQSDLNTLNNNNSLAIKQAIGNDEQVEFAPPLYENSNGELNRIEQQSYYSKPHITPVEGETTIDSNYNNSQYMSQYQTNGDIGIYEVGSNNAEIGSYSLQNNNQYSYEATNLNSAGGIPQSSVNYASPQKYITDSYQYASNQYSTSTDSNYYPSNYATYQTSGTSYETHSYNDVPNTYNYTTTQYTQPSIETSSNSQTYQSYETTVNGKNLYNTLPVITPVEPEPEQSTSAMSSVLTSNKSEKNTIGTGTSHYQIHTSPYVSSSLGLPISQTYNTVYKINSNIISKENIPQTTKSTRLTDDSNYQKFIQQKRTTIATSRQYNPPITQTVPQKSNIQEPNLELQKLKSQTSQVQSLKTQISQLDPLKKQIEEISSLKNQLLELNSLKAQVAELTAVKSQLSELNNLKQQVDQMKVIKKEIEELNTLHKEASKKSTGEVLKKRIEELEKSKLEYEKVIKKIKEKPQLSGNLLLKGSNMQSKGLESKQLTFEDKAKQIRVKGEIIHNTEELELLIRKINKLNIKLTLNLLYKATADSDQASAFHEKCDDARSTIVLVETDKGKRFGGYTTCSWSGDCIDKKDEDAFIFSLDKMKIYENVSGEDAIGCYPKFGPIFLGCQIRIYDNFFTKGGTTFEKGLNFNTEEDYELNDGERTFLVKEIEVYEVIAQ